MIPLTEKYTDQQGKTFYEPVMSRTTGVSKYRASEHSLEGIEGFWEQGRNSMPPAGTIAWFTLASKPKGGNANPGSRYRDIIEVTRASDEDKANYLVLTRGPQQDAGRYNGPPPGSAASPQQPANSTIESRILLGMAFNNLTTVLTMKDAAKYLADGVDGWELWNKWFSEASRGLPLTPVEDEAGVNEVLTEAAALDQQAEDAINEPAPPAEDVEILPW